MRARCALSRRPDIRERGVHMKFAVVFCESAWCVAVFACPLPVDRSLSMVGNSLAGTLPSTLSGLKAAVSIDLSGNWLNGSIPATISALTGLTYVGMQAVGATVAWCACTRVLNLAWPLMSRSLNLASNAFSGSIPALSALRSLVYVGFASVLP